MAGRRSIGLALTQLVSRAVYPGSEFSTSRWIRDNSAVCEITGYPMEKINKDKLYRSAHKLYSIKEGLENHFVSQDKQIVLISMIV
ncbi:MAG: hypothetical protein IPI42_08690 [Saprospiraceae bacterium]|nr:hypothetical protein [Candidatus Parvibacillus calidus]